MKLFLLSDPNNTHTHRWVTSLAKQDVDIFLFGLNKCDLKVYEPFGNVQVYYFDYISSLNDRLQNGSFEKVKYLSAIVELRKKIKEFKPDILHAHYATSYGLLGVLSGFHPFIISVWGSDVYCFPKRSFLHSLLLRYIFSRADKILSTSRVMANEANKYTRQRIEITPFGVDVNLFKHKYVEKSNKEFIIGTVKTLAPIYGIDTLIKAFKIVHEQNKPKITKLIIIGEGEQELELKKLVLMLELDDVVSFLGRINNSDLPDYYNYFDVSVSLSNSESFGVVAVESMACECPVVVSDAEGFTEIVENMNTGIVVPKRSPQLAADAIQYFIDNPHARAKQGKAGRERVCELYDWLENVRSMLGIYCGILK